MQIHVVNAGDTLTQISRTYSVSVNRLIESNQILNPNDLVPGQTIVIPIWGSYYFIQPGDSIYTISYRNQVPVNEIIRLNQIQNPKSLQVGTRIYLPQKPRKAVYTGGYLDTDITGVRTQDVIKEVGKYLSSYQLFSYHMSAQGELTPPRLEEQAIQAINTTKGIPMMVLTNIDEGQFSTEVATTVLSSDELQNKVLDSTVAIIDEKGYKGLDIDFEYLGAENRDNYNRFLAKARARLNAKGIPVSTALAPKISDEEVGVLYEGHDYAFHGRTANFIFFMTYEWGWTGGPPRAVSPLNEVKKVLDYALTRVPKEKIMMGIPLYGYDWTLPFVSGQTRARAISSQQAIMLAKDHNVSIRFDPVAASPFFKYVDDAGKDHEVWFEDARSIQAKFDLVKSLDIRGFFYWVLGRDFPQNWLLVEDNFIIRLM